MRRGECHLVLQPAHGVGPWGLVPQEHGLPCSTDELSLRVAG